METNTLPITTHPTLMRQHPNNRCSFITFKNFEELGAWYLSQPIKQRNFYEVIYAQPQKPKFDLEINSKELSFDLWNYYVDTIIDTIYKVYGNIEITEYTSHDPKKKWSTHIVVQDYIVADNKEANKFIRHVINALPTTDILQIIDLSVYKSIQMFRLDGSTKIGEFRYKYKKGQNKISENFLNELVSNVGNKKQIQKIKDISLGFIKGAKPSPF
jgi:hypothetical protein